MDQNGAHHGTPIDLRDLIENRIPSQRTALEETHTNLENVARYCEENYYSQRDKGQALHDTKRYALQSLASVAYQIDVLAKDVLDMLTLQSAKIGQLATTVNNAAMAVDLQKEKVARRDIGVLTTNKCVPKQQKIIMPDTVEPIRRYKREPIDYSVLDGLGHGTKSAEPTILPGSRGTISRAASGVSGNNYGGSQYGTYSHYSSPMNNMATLSRASTRLVQDHHYRVPQVQTVPVVEPSRFSSMTSASSAYGPGTPSSVGSGSHSGDRYGTLRAPQRQDSSMSGMTYDGGRRTPTLHTLSSMIHQSNDLPLPPPPAMNGIDDDLPLPPPNLFDTTADWIPQEYIERAIALYDYDADKPDELTLRANCLVYVIRKNEDGWYEGVLDGVTGLFPGNYVVPA